ncbi:hypothetical protein BMS3Abin07_01150 [bacterium BMS3Abin07]|nr:hypothetical protein BMS3Abin07_01150 [bacterium BMS3Abin07]GBE31575.1 hypothetical protein BMS3Bbin05_00478 [bacterium BMS3Bbin05]HDL21205.1 hypothetical protein [Nitrospirota bacterium]HDO23113.1 hypothetical protein [Nitrospirota bacterium]HDZ88131.1 hypothetical protein [Nitrospirota bacterium]
MKEEIELRERLKMVERELGTLVDELQKLEKEMKEMKEMKDELKAIKLFLGKEFPDFRNRYPELLKKICAQS